MGIGSSYSHSDAATGRVSRVIRLRSEDDDDDLIVEEGGCRHTVSVSTSSSGVVVGCTRMSWKAYDRIKREIDRLR
jgi:hypothetical protein